MQNLPRAVTDPQSLVGLVLKVDLRSWLKMLAALFKLRIVLLLLVSAMGGAVLGAGGWPGLQSVSLLLLTGGLSAAGASAVNQYLERERDANMVRTRRRPLPSGAIKRSIWVLLLGGGMVLFAVVFSALYNPALAISNGIGAVIYIWVYTIWLKPRTVLNIVIGGAAGSMAAISGGAAAHAWNEPGVLALSLLIFAWTPTHFWSLAMAYRKDYAQAGFPMLPVNVSMRRAAWWVAIHTFATGAVAVLLGFHPALGMVYLVPVSLCTLQYMRLTVHLLQDPTGKEALGLFKYSNIFLSVVQLIIILIPLFK